MNSWHGRRFPPRVTTTDLFWLAALLVVGLLAFGPGLTSGWFSDDFAYVYESPGDRLLYFFSHRNLYHPFYRPVNASILALSQFWFGRTTFPNHLLTLVAHVGLAWLVYRFIRTRFSSTAAAVGALYLLVAQASANAVLSNDTLSQVGGTLAGCFALWLLAGDPDSEAPIARGRFVAALASFAVALLFKEGSVIFGPMIALTLWWRGTDAVGLRRGFWRAVLVSLPFAMVAVVYMAFRSRLELPAMRWGTLGYYDFHLGLNVVSNLVRMLGTAVIPTSSVTLAVALAEGNRALLALIALGAFAFVAAVLVGLRRERSKSLLVLMACLAVLGLFPMAIMMHVSELYIYNSLPFIAVIVGAGLGNLLNQATAAPARRAAILAGFGLFAALQVQADWQKAGYLRENGRWAADVVGQITPFIADVPPGGHLVLVNPPPTRTQFSLYIMDGFKVLQDGWNILYETSDRTDFSVDIVDADQVAALRLGPNTVELGLRDGKVMLW